MCRSGSGGDDSARSGDGRCRIASLPLLAGSLQTDVHKGAEQLSAAFRSADSSRAPGSAFGSADRAAAARCAAANRSACKSPAAPFAPAASGRARYNLDSDTVLSSRADIALFWPRKNARAGDGRESVRRRKPLNASRVCARSRSMSTKIDTISSGRLAGCVGSSPAGHLSSANVPNWERCSCRCGRPNSASLRDRPPSFWHRPVPAG